MAIVQHTVQAALDAYGIKHRILECDENMADTTTFCRQYGFQPEQCANTILVVSKKIEPVQYVVCVVLAAARLDVNKAVCKEMGVKRASFASAEETTEQTGMIIGGVVAIGIENLPIFIDAAVMAQTEVIMGGGNRTSKIALSPKELLRLPRARIIQKLALPRTDV